jgi:RNA polymerase sigma factor (sigma-70 family)
MKTTFEENYSTYRLLIYKVANSFNIEDNYHKQELHQCGRIGLHLAISTWNEDKGPFIPWLKIYLKKEMVEYINANLRTIRIPCHQLYKHENFNPDNPTDIPTISMSLPLNNDSNETIADTIKDIQEEYTETDTSQLRKAISMLKPKYRVIMEMTADGADGKQIADHLNVTRQAVSEMKKKAIIKLQELMIK